MFGSIDTQIKQDVWQAMLKTARNWERLLDEHLKKYNLTFRQYLLLNAIQKNTDGKPSITKAAKAMGTTRQNVKQIIDSLEKRGFLKVEKNKKDKRNMKVSIINLDRSFWNNSEDDNTSFIDSLFSGLKQSEIYSLHEIMQKLEKTADEMIDQK